MQSLADANQIPVSGCEPRLRECDKQEGKCAPISFDLESDEIVGDCCDWVFGIRWGPEEFLAQAVSVGHPFTVFSGSPAEVRDACRRVAECDEVDTINNRCSKLGEWLRLSRSFQKEEEVIKAAMPMDRRRILESKRLCLMRHIINEEKYDDAELASDLENGFSLVGDVPRLA